MRNIKPLFLTILASICIIMFTQCNGKPEVQNGTQSNCTIATDSTRGIKIVYVNLDTIMYRYEFALDITRR